MNHNHCCHNMNYEGKNVENYAYYTCPMHPEIKRNRPGMCPECGMNLVPAKIKKVKHGQGKSEENDKHAGHSTTMFLKKFWLSLVLTIPVVLYSDVVSEFLRFNLPQFVGSQFIPFVLGTIIFFYCGWVFLAGAARELRARLPGMMTLIALAISAAYLWSVFAVFSGNGHTLFWELTTLITVMLLGHYIEMRTVSSAQSALKELSKLLPDEAEVIRSGKTVKISLDELKEGDVVFIRPGSRVPADGEVIEGVSDMNEAMITGESAPVKKKIGNQVIAGTVNGDGSIKAKITKVGEHTFLAGVMRLVAEAQASKSKLQILSDRAAFYLTLVAILTGSFTFIVWLIYPFAGESALRFAFERLVAVLVVACPHALGLAVPLVAAISTMMAAQRGFLIRERMALESARNVSVVLFDKTGTLTEGAPEVHEIKIGKNFYPAIYSLEKNSAHPLAIAIVRKFEKIGVVHGDVEDFRNFSGRGITGVFNGTRYFSGNYAFLKEHDIELPDSDKEEIKKQESLARTVVMFANEEEYLGFISLSDKVKPSSKQAVNDLKKMGLEVVMLTGDNTLTAGVVAKELGIDNYHARLSPQEKIEVIKKYQSDAKKVAMVGDGINDAPALTQADVGIAIGAGTNVAIESAGIILVRNDPRDITKVIRLSRLTYTKMIQNLFWAAGYNIVAIPLAAGILASKGILLEPAVAALFMSLSTVIVAINAVILKRKKL